jgi:hypothetical protein
VAFYRHKLRASSVPPGRQPCERQRLELLEDVADRGVLCARTGPAFAYPVRSRRKPFAPAATADLGVNGRFLVPALDGYSGRFAAADAQRGDATPCIVFVHRRKQGNENARPGGADGMAQCASAAVDIDPLMVQG